MARARLTDEERAAKRRASWGDAGYRHYDTSQGFGSPAEWAGIAARWEELAEEWAARAGRFEQGPAGKGKGKVKITPDMARLGLAEMPADPVELKTAFRKAMFAAHPDHGGTDAAAIAVSEAFERLKLRYVGKKS